MGATGFVVWLISAIGLVVWLALRPRRSLRPESPSSRLVRPPLEAQVPMMASTNPESPSPAAVSSAASPAASNATSAPLGSIVERAPVPASRRGPTDPVVVRAADPPVAAPSTFTPIAPPPGAVVVDRNTPEIWVPLGTSVWWDGVLIKGGGFYIGRPRNSAQSFIALVDPALKIDTAKPDWASPLLFGNWPRYEDMTPQSRGAFVAFLGSPRTSTALNDAFYYLYLHGLERRLLDNSDSAAVAAEAEGLIAEVYRLALIDVWRTTLGVSSERLLRVSRLRYIPEVFDPGSPVGRPMALNDGWKISLGLLVHKGAGLPADWALWWARLLSEAAPRARTHLIEADMQALFAVLYQKRFPNGIIIRRGGARLSVPYRWSGDRDRHELVETGVPDVSTLSDGAAPLIDLLEKTLTDLEPLRRARLGPHRSWVVEALATPLEIRSASTTGPEFQALTAVFDDLERKPVVKRPTSEVLVSLGFPAEALAKGSAVRLALALDVIGLAMEPDPRFGSPVPKDQVFLFRLPADAVDAPSGAYKAAHLVVQAAVVMAHSDGEVVRDEEAAIDELCAALRLAPSEITRLRVYAASVHADPPVATRVLAAVKKLEPSTRHQMAQALVAVAAADGHISKAETRLVIRFYRALGLDINLVATDLHHAAAARQAREQGQEGPRPTQLRASSEGASGALDADRIQRIIADTAAVQATLASIFVDEPPAPAAVPPTPVAVDQQAAGLDAEHAALLARILAHVGDLLPRMTFDAWCVEFELLPNSAIDVINEVATTQCGEMLLEGEDPLEVGAFARQTFGELGNSEDMRG